MSQLHQLVEQLIETLKFGLHFETTKTSGTPLSLPQDYTAVLDEINEKLKNTTRKENPDLAILQLIFHTVRFIHNSIRMNRDLDEGLKTQIVIQLFELITTFRKLCLPPDTPSSPMKSSKSLDDFVEAGSPTLTYGKYQQIEFNRLLDNGGYTPLGEVLYEHFAELIKLSYPDSEALSLKIGLFVEQYQQEVTRLHLRTEIERLEKTVLQLQEQLHILTTKEKQQEAEIEQLRLVNAELEKNQRENTDSTRELKLQHEAQIARLSLVNSQLEHTIQQLKLENTTQRKLDADAARLRLESRQMRDTFRRLGLPQENSRVKPTTPPPATTAKDSSDTQSVYPETFFPPVPRSPTTRVIVVPQSSSSLDNEHSSSHIIHSNSECCSM